MRTHTERLDLKLKPVELAQVKALGEELGLGASSVVRLAVSRLWAQLRREDQLVLSPEVRFAANQLKRAGNR